MNISSLIKKRNIEIDANEPISHLLGKMQKEKEKQALVYSKGKFLGILSKKTFLKSKINTNEAKVENFTKRIGTINKETDILEAAYEMFNMDTDTLPVEDKGKIIGTINVFDLIGRINDYPELKKKTIKETKTTRFIAVYEDDRIGHALNLMRENHVYNLPVLDYNAKLTGILTITDIINKLFLYPIKREHSTARSRTRIGLETDGQDHPDMLALPIKHFETRNQLITAEDNEKINQTTKKMTKNNIHSIIITENNQATGIITANDILKTLAQQWTQPTNDITYSGMKKVDLTEHQETTLKELSSTLGAKIKRQLKQPDANIHIRIKEHKHQGTQHKYIIHINIDYPGMIIASHEADWDLQTAIRKTFNNIEKQIEHHFHE